VRDNTDLFETTPWVFLMHDTYTDAVLGEVAKRTLTIE
jgi:hypothetical protein